MIYEDIFWRWQRDEINGLTPVWHVGLESWPEGSAIWRFPMGFFGLPFGYLLHRKNGKIHHFLLENTIYFGLGHGLTIAMLVITISIGHFP